ncbi:hypothetical protein NE857_21885 [Nocardiopsis exhalans]|uniref:Uncharacterized protein n=1 Tax=Nocardiopsis exhalans TaxID=163604 RepID=A0ABY5D114_9ACTN|nr:hypothetical protein [Nocardiopsis exhalans]USY17969.1 hypothetical protein NE857_21885 [Nocardiopsis exhalans]
MNALAKLDNAFERRPEVVAAVMGALWGVTFVVLAVMSGVTAGLVVRG